jgi:tetratricopeptide (TPR) repeat protein
VRGGRIGKVAGARFHDPAARGDQDGWEDGSGMVALARNPHEMPARGAAGCEPKRKGRAWSVRGSEAPMGVSESAKPQLHETRLRPARAALPGRGQSRSPSFPWVWLALLFGVLPFSVSARASDSEADGYVKMGETLYATYNVAPVRLDQAIECFEKALALEPHSYLILSKLAEMYQMKGQSLGEDHEEEKVAAWEKGAEYGEQAIAANPKGKEGHFYYMANIGAAAQLQGMLTAVWKFRKIKKELDRTLELDPAWPRALVAKGQYLTEMPGLLGGSREEAERLYKRAAELDPHCSVGLVFLADLQADKEQYDAALASLEKVLFCPNAGNCGNWAMADCPKAVKMLDKICGQMGSKARPPCGKIAQEHCKSCPP